MQMIYVCPASFKPAASEESCMRTSAKNSRRATVQRETRETRIELSLNLEGQGTTEVHTGVPFLDHMLTLFSVHGFFDLKIQASGDLAIDAHHTVEDVGICLGDALRRALGNREGICRYGEATVPMDEARACVVLDLSNRACLVYQVPPIAACVGQFETELVPEFFRAFCAQGGVTQHITVPCGSNTHHVLEAIFKAWGKALERAVRLDPRRKGVPSSKGTL
jgi:imidazoleglycerol-phosphate dehydratase